MNNSEKQEQVIQESEKSKEKNIIQSESQKTRMDQIIRDAEEMENTFEESQRKQEQERNNI